MFVREINKLNLELTIGDFLSLPSSVLELTILVKIAIITKMLSAARTNSLPPVSAFTAGFLKNSGTISLHAFSSICFRANEHVYMNQYPTHTYTNIMAKFSQKQIPPDQIQL